MSFSKIIGQPELIARLGNALSGVPGHAYVLQGPIGSGRRTVARAFAKALLCPNATEQGSCDRCDSCRHFDHGVHPDFVTLSPEIKDKVIKVERVRRSVCADVQMKPQFSARKVYLIMADELNEQGQNALLKTLEEPPAYAVFLLITIRSERLLSTVRSRVIPLTMARLQQSDIAKIISQAHESADLSMEQITFYARYAAGIPGAALDLLSQEWFAPLRKDVAAFYFQLSESNSADLLTDGYTFFDANRSHVSEMLDILNSLVRDELVLVTTESTQAIINRDFVTNLCSKKKNHTARQTSREQSLTRVSEAIHQTRKALSVNVSFEISICQLLIVLRRELSYA
jgi:DNA polymerase-3 subunit delta'